MSILSPNGVVGAAPVIPLRTAPLPLVGIRPLLPQLQFLVWSVVSALVDMYLDSPRLALITKCTALVPENLLGSPLQKVRRGRLLVFRPQC